MGLVILHAVLLLAALLVLPTVLMLSVDCQNCYGASRTSCEEMYDRSAADDVRVCFQHDSNSRQELIKANRRKEWKELPDINVKKQMKDKLRDLVAAQKAKNPSGWTAAMEPPEHPPLVFSANHDKHLMKLEFWFEKVGKAVEEGKDLTNFNEEFEKDLETNRDKYKKEFEQKQKETWGPFRDHAYEELLDEEIYDSWCGTFEGKNGGFRRGCGVYIEGMEFKEGCHKIKKGQFAGVKYCRCDSDDCNDKKNDNKRGGSKGEGLQEDGNDSRGIEKGRGSVWLVVTSAVALLIARQERA